MIKQGFKGRVPYVVKTYGSCYLYVEWGDSYAFLAKIPCRVYDSMFEEGAIESETVPWGDREIIPLSN